MIFFNDSEIAIIEAEKIMIQKWYFVSKIVLTGLLREFFFYFLKQNQGKSFRILNSTDLIY